MIREIMIKPVLNGFVVRVGCQTVVFASREALLGDLKRYLEDAEGVEKIYRKNALNAWILDQPGNPEPSHPVVTRPFPPAGAAQGEPCRQP